MIAKKTRDMLPAKFEQLINESIWDGFGETITGAEYKARTEKVKGKIEEEGWDAMLVFGDCYRMSNTALSTGYTRSRRSYSWPPGQTRCFSCLTARSVRRTRNPQ